MAEPQFDFQNTQEPFEELEIPSYGEQVKKFMELHGISIKRGSAIETRLKPGEGSIIDGDFLVNGTIGASKIIAGTITATEIAAGTITATEIAANTITANNIAANTITSTEIAANTITGNQIQAIEVSDMDSVSLPTNGVLIHGGGIIGRAGGATTFELDASDGSALFKGTIEAAEIKGQIEVQSSAGTVTGSLGGFQGGSFTQVILSTGDLDSGDSLVIAQSGTTDYAGLLSGNRELIVYGGTSGTGTVEVSNANFLPGVNNSLNLGSTTKSWDNLYINDLYNGSTWLLDLNETAGMICRTKPFGLLSRSTTPGTASSYTGYMYYDTTKTTIVFSDGAGWFAVQASAY